VLYILSERGWPVMAFRPPTDRRFTVLAVFREDDQAAALRLLGELAQRATRDARNRGAPAPAGRDGEAPRPASPWSAPRA
jgi:hypothetical protein